MKKKYLSVFVFFFKKNRDFFLSSSFLTEETTLQNHVGTNKIANDANFLRSRVIFLSANENQDHCHRFEIETCVILFQQNRQRNNKNNKNNRNNKTTKQNGYRQSFSFCYYNNRPQRKNSNSNSNNNKIVDRLKERTI